MNNSNTTPVTPVKAKLAHKLCGDSVIDTKKDEVVIIREVMVGLGSNSKTNPCDLYRVENLRGHKYCIASTDTTPA